MMRRIKPLVYFFTMLLLVSCTVGPDYKRPQPPQIERYTAKAQPKKIEAAGVVQQIHTNQDIPGQWWQAFHSDQLNHLVELGLSNSPTVAKAKAKLLEAQANFQAEYGDSQFPSVDAQASVIRQKFNLDSIGVSAIPSPPPFTLYNVGINVAYTLDIFGAKRRELEALCALVDYQRYEWLAAKLTLSTNIVTTAVRLASLQAQINLHRGIVELQADQVAIMDKRLAAGGVSQINFIDQEAQKAQAKSQLAPLEKQWQQTRHQLAIYLGLPPDSQQIPSIQLSDLQLPKDLPLSIASQLLRQRPDVQAAEALLHQASANVGVATANLFPTLTINGTLASEATHLSQLFAQTSSVWSIGPNLTQPIFHGGALRSKRRAACAAYEQALAAYKEVTLQAFQNVADSLKALEYDAKSLQDNGENARIAQQRWQITDKRYQVGGVSYAQLLDANQQYVEAQLAEQQSIADRLANTAALFQALGGGWWNLSPEQIALSQPTELPDPTF